MANYSSMSAHRVVQQGRAANLHAQQPTAHALPAALPSRLHHKKRSTPLLRITEPPEVSLPITHVTCSVPRLRLLTGKAAQCRQPKSQLGLQQRKSLLQAAPHSSLSSDMLRHSKTHPRRRTDRHRLSECHSRLSSHSRSSRENTENYVKIHLRDCLRRIPKSPETYVVQRDVFGTQT